MPAIRYAHFAGGGPQGCRCEHCGHCRTGERTRGIKTTQESTCSKAAELARIPTYDLQPIDTRTEACKYFIEKAPT